jgi:hypothetical protein
MLRIICRFGLACIYLGFAAVPSTELASSSPSQPSAQSPREAKQARVTGDQGAIRLADLTPQLAKVLSSIQDSESRIQVALAALQKLPAQSPQFAQSRDTDIIELKELLAHVQQLRQQAESLAAGARGEAAAGGSADQAELAATISRLNSVAREANANANRADQIRSASIWTYVKPDNPIKLSEPPQVWDASKDLTSGNTSQKDLFEGPPGSALTHEDTQHPASSADSGDAEAAWFAKLQNGLLQYHVPDTMQWKVASTVSVVIGGEKAGNTQPIDNQTGSASIKVSRHMNVIAFSPDNPDEFIITNEPGTQNEQYVPEDGTTSWNFSVTPRYTGKVQKIAVRAWVIYDKDTQREMPVYSAVVNVRVPSLGECVKRLFEGDPDYWLKYGLPGGAGFIFVSGLVTALWKWVSRKKRTQSPTPVG